VPKGSFLLLPLILSAAVAGAQVGQASRKSESNISNAISGSALSCSQPHTFAVPPSPVQNGRPKARLLVLLRDSLYDDASGVVNIAREQGIKKLANRLRNEKDE
jgi:hypothetical protein